METTSGGITVKTRLSSQCKLSCSRRKGGINLTERIEQGWISNRRDSFSDQGLIMDVQEIQLDQHVLRVRSLANEGQVASWVKVEDILNSIISTPNPLRWY